jgi:hypothetical protein
MAATVADIMLSNKAVGWQQGCYHGWLAWLTQIRVKKCAFRTAGADQSNTNILGNTAGVFVV